MRQNTNEEKRGSANVGGKTKKARYEGCASVRGKTKTEKWEYATVCGKTEKRRGSRKGYKPLILMPKALQPYS